MLNESTAVRRYDLLVSLRLDLAVACSVAVQCVLSIYNAVFGSYSHWREQLTESAATSHTVPHTDTVMGTAVPRSGKAQSSS